MAAWQAGMQSGQRGAKEHPAGSERGRGDGAFDGRERLLAVGFEGGDGGEQSAGVGMRGAGEDVGDGAAFDDSSGIHDGDAVADAADHGEVVRDEEHGQREALAQFGEQRENLRLHGDIERGGGLVGDEQGGAVDDGHGDHDALALASGELMG